MSKKEMMVPKLSILRIIAQYEPFYLIASSVKIMSKVILTWLMVWFPKLFIEKITENDKNDYHNVILKISTYTALLLVLWLISEAVNHIEIKCTERFIYRMKQEIGQVSMKQSYFVIESGAYREQINLAGNVANTLKAVGILEAIIEGLISTIGLAGLLIRYDVRICVLIMSVVLLKTIFVNATVRYSIKRRYLYGANDRIGNYLTNTAYMNSGAAKEIRINRLSNWFMRKVSEYRNEMLQLQYEDYRVIAMSDLASAFIILLQTAIVLMSLSSRAITGDISIADFTMYFTTMTTISSVLTGVVSKFGEYNQYKIYLGDYSLLFKTIEDTGKGADITDGDLVFKNVSFKYPGTDNYALKNIDLRIKKGEKISIAGLNGAGKSTLVKLICKFYQPSEGSIELGGKNIWELKTEEYFKHLSAVFQDYVSFAFSIRENVTMGRSDNNYEEIIHKKGMHNIISELPLGYDTVVSRVFDEKGYDLSGGELQKIAMLRAVCKKSSIMILDEPTRALDAKAEKEMYDNFFKIMEGQTAIFISHRLASSSIAERIIVMANGQIDDQGTHHELMNRQGLYYEMYKKQSEAYGE